MIMNKSIVGLCDCMPKHRCHAFAEISFWVDSVWCGGKMANDFHFCPLERHFSGDKYPLNWHKYGWRETANEGRVTPHSELWAVWRCARLWSMASHQTTIQFSNPVLFVYEYNIRIDYRAYHYRHFRGIEKSRELRWLGRLFPRRHHGPFVLRALLLHFSFFSSSSCLSAQSVWFLVCYCRVDIAFLCRSHIHTNNVV